MKMQACTWLDSVIIIINLCIQIQCQILLIVCFLDKQIHRQQKKDQTVFCQNVPENVFFSYSQILIMMLHFIMRMINRISKNTKMIQSHPLTSHKTIWFGIISSETRVFFFFTYLFMTKQCLFITPTPHMKASNRQISGCDNHLLSIAWGKHAVLRPCLLAYNEPLKQPL